ncbi:ROK family transcriptional regulator [Mesorhizobium sp. LHD-90]|uniref:ROK family transcriptional regulator n=1 Tax=Mesorhizobium sp. LHD-90 TaxID=3071414 RepID=UPI0027E0F05F|nr:ROK family transcriptional regulator [Mesorhizobium sp. LHD-90]MDQ6433580.1 ROK family transcriptional regulator [Mesorhizobium sp. LHD-90]
MSVGIRHDDLRKRNRAMVISAVRRAGQVSRTDIAATTGLSHSTISAISADLIAEGILTEAKGAEAGAARRGRPQVAIGLNPEAAAVVAIVLLFNFLSVAVVDFSGRVIVEERRKLSTFDLSEDELVGECIAMVRRQTARREVAGRDVLRIVLAVQGTTDAVGREMLWSPITAHEGVDFGGRLEKAFGVPVTVENDCNMIAVALRWHDPDRYRDDFIAILLSHGIGMGLVLKGDLFTGTHSSGGEFGHMVHRPDGALCRCGRRGCVEAYAGNYAIWRSASGASEDEAPISDISVDDMARLAVSARDHDGPEREAYQKAGEALGYGLGSLFALIDPAPVAMVGIGAAAFDLIEPSLRATIGLTAGGQHSKAISFATYADELPLITLGCAMRALTFIDTEVLAVGGQTAARGKDVA